ncbi:methyltransferase [Candidatus Microgenomates bacterium]|nr:MAG: methyltransferase [Candidatus Microgenomates bacterium]
MLLSSSFSPWETDSKFQRIYQQIQPFTLVDQYKSYELWQLVEQVRKIPGVIIEVGVWRGGSGTLIAQRARERKIHTKIYLCDTFCGIVKAGKKDNYYRGGEYADTSQNAVERLLRRFHLRDVCVLQGIFPDETGKYITEKKVRLCHIDVDVYESTKDILNWVWPKLSLGGMVIFDDYGFQACEGVTTLVNEQRQKKDRLIIHNLNGHAIMVKIH